MLKILIVEDDKTMADQLAILLEHNGYESSTLTLFDHALEEVLASHADLILLDLGLPHIDGQFLCREIRRQSNVPIIVLTSKNSELDEVMSLTAGADDFVSKPYSTQVLLMRIERLLSRVAQAQGESSNIQAKGLILNLQTCTAQCIATDQEAALTKNEMKILALLMRESPYVVSRQTIQEELWMSDEFVDDNTLTVNISHLRKTLSSIGAADVIQTRRGLGYVL